MPPYHIGEFCRKLVNNDNKSCFLASSDAIVASQTMERRHLFPIFWIFFLVINAINGQEYVANAPDIVNEIVDQPSVIDQNVTECPASVHTFLQNTTRALFLNEIMPDIDAKLAQKDEVTSQLNFSINEIKVRNVKL